MTDMAISPRQRPDWRIEDAEITKGNVLICGVDEVGRGPLAGPVTAAAVILQRDMDPEVLRQIDDSKRVPVKRRESLALHIKETAFWGIGHAGVEEIDAINIRMATHLAMCRAIENLCERHDLQPDLVLVDGHEIPEALNLPAICVIKGDSVSLSIAAASILAKTTRDAIMVGLAQQHPGYGWEKNVGYPTKAHIEALHRIGITPNHRRSFKTIHKILYQAP